MKKLISILFLFTFITANAQEIFKTVPNSLVTIDYSSYRIDGVAGRIVEMPLTLTDSMVYTIYLEFYRADTSGNFVAIPRSAMNADRADFDKGVRAAVPNGTPDSFVNSKVNNIMKAMIAGTAAEKWQAYNAIMTGYGAALKPLNEQ
jgi:hypothetical protein